MAEKLYKKLDAVVDKKSFLTFVKILVADRRNEVAKEKENLCTHWEVDANGWEHGTIEGYLEAAVAWAEDSQGHSFELPEEASWRAFAQFLYCGKIYE
jgi:hypothetical protein